jgi:hypothetical protein
LTPIIAGSVGGGLALMLIFGLIAFLVGRARRQPTLAADDLVPIPSASARSEVIYSYSSSNLSSAVAAHANVPEYTTGNL